MLDGPAWGPAAGKPPRQLVVLCHGYGANGEDLIDLAPLWGQALPGALFIAVQAPETVPGYPQGRQWFPLTDRDPARMEEGARRARPALDAFLDTTLARLGLPAEAYTLMGFSQGAMMALYAGLRRPTPPRAILAYSGLLPGGPALAREIAGHPPVLLVHGEADEVVPVAAGRATEAALRGAGVPVEAYYAPGLGHGIDQAGITLGGLALQRGFAEQQPVAR
jgi:phospholipase/carboxylesterase